MKRLSLTILIILVLTLKGFSQDFIWNAGFFSFFDNIEFGGSLVKVPQTMAGVTISPEAGIVFDSVHKISVGINLLHEFGSPDFLDRVIPTAYYEYNWKPFNFIMGAFPRSRVLDQYPRLFFQDSVSYYRPNVNGMFFQYGGADRYVNIWLDWTGRQSQQVRETFLAGLSGRYNLGVFYLRHFSYMFHFASRKDPLYDEALHDNLLFLTSAGADLSGLTIFNRLEGSAGWVMGLERARADNTGWIDMHGLLVEASAEYRFAGITTTFYVGKGLMSFYNDHDNELYWGDPVYRARISDRTDLFFHFLRRDGLRLDLTWSLHFLEGRVYHEQMLKLWIDLGGRRKISGRV